ncbi:ABC transporter permease [Proteiniborus sp. MB09-C3]|uniref:ABC transporter permease n=1 Tax=Proteiniborus sp. MB09-C3 TaxID=3050072 RepID=UPI0025524349|nr:ABC transporter permease [Proteiniborus sp. MB09-C3]WIV13321.1 ABC transporter permease [Proteiniborus sp. MB09-C3]
MISTPLYKHGIKGGWRLWIILAAVITMYFTIIVTMFDPELGAALSEFAKAMPELMSMFGMDYAGTTLVGFMSSYLYGFIMLVFPMVFSILTANRLVARQIDRGAMAYILASPISRKKIAYTQASVLCTGVFMLILFSTLVGITAAKIFFPGELEIGKFLMLNLGTLALQLFISSICFICSCIFNDTKFSVSFGAGIPSLCFIIQMIANVGDKLKNAKYATFFTLFNTEGILAREVSAYWGIAILFAGALILYASSIIVFSKKDIPV